MKVDCIPFKNTGYFSNIITDYLENHKNLKAFYKYKPAITNFEEVIENKQFSQDSRDVLVDSLKNQYKTGKIDLKKNEAVLNAVESLKEQNTFTITTGHQLNLFTGPLYFIYKIASVIKLTQELAILYPDQNFVPIYWMATEDHDLEEINHFFYKGRKYQWKTDQTGAVGRMNLEGLKEVFENFKEEFVDYSTNGEEIQKLFSDAYLKHENLTSATRFLANKLFSKYGLVIIDGDDSKLKRLFYPVIKKELLTEFSSEKVEETNKELAKNYKIQVNPRDINLFYLKDNIRERIVKQNDGYQINDTGLKFSESELLTELDNHPERFSPNVILRPLYQECILPNLAYIGGGGELAYWLQLKTTFEAVKVPFPMLILRNSAKFLDERHKKNFNKLGISLEELFEEKGVLSKKWVVKNASRDLTLTNELLELKQTFKELAKKSKLTDVSLVAHVQALEVLHEKSIKQLSEKLIRAERRKESTAMERIEFLKETLFPKGGLQERKENFSVIYLTEGQKMIEDLIDAFEVPTNNFYIFS